VKEDFRFEFRLLAVVLSLAAGNVPSITQTVDPKANAILSLMQHGRDLQQKGDFLSACRILRFVTDHSKDSSTQAEAIYRSLSCGDGAVSVLNVQRSAFYHLRVLQIDSTLEAEMSRTQKEQVAAFRRIGVPITLSRYSDGTFANTDTISRQLLTKVYRHTPFGELTAFELIEYEVSPEGLVGATDPNVIIKRSLAFLTDYPHSTYSNDVHLILGQAFQDLWTCSLPDMIDYSDVLTASQKADPEQVRQEAIQHLELARQSRDRLVKRKWDRYHDEGLDSLRAKQHTHILYYVPC